MVNSPDFGCSNAPQCSGKNLRSTQTHFKMLQYQFVAVKKIRKCFKFKHFFIHQVWWICGSVIKFKYSFSPSSRGFSGKWRDFWKVTSLEGTIWKTEPSYFLLFSLHISSDFTCIFNKSRLTFTISPFPSSTPLLFKKPFLLNALGQDVVNDSGMIWKNSGQGQLLLCPLTLSFYS